MLGALGEVLADDAVGVGPDVVGPEAAGGLDRREVGEDHGDGGRGVDTGGELPHAGNPADGQGALPVVGRVEAHHREPGVACGGDRRVEVGVRVGVVDVRVAEEDVEDDRPGLLGLELLDELAEDLARPGPAAVVGGQGGEGALVDVDDDDVGARRGDAQAVLHHGVEGLLTHAGDEVEGEGVEAGDQGEGDGEVEVEVAPHPGAEAVAGQRPGAAQRVGQAGHGSSRDAVGRGRRGGG